MPIPASYDSNPDHGGSGKERYKPVLWPNTFVTWRGGDGATIPLTGDIQCSDHPAGIGILWGPQGFDMPTYDVKADALPNMDGSMFKSIRATTRDITIPIRIQALDRTSLIEIKQRLFHSLNPHNGKGYLTITEGDGLPRHLECYYVDGAQGAEGQDAAGFCWITYGLVFRAMDPYWYSNAERQFDWFLAEKHNKPFLSNATAGYPDFFPLRIGASSFNPDAPITVTNDSSVQCWPVWTIDGPIAGLSLTNTTTGRSIAFLDDFDIKDGERVVIDTRPGVKTVTLLGSGTNLWPKLKPVCDMWPLVSGDNTITINGGSAAEHTMIRLHFVPRYLSYSGG